MGSLVLINSQSSPEIKIHQSKWRIEYSEKWDLLKIKE
jgi:hypothetical protein